MNGIARLLIQPARKLRKPLTKESFSTPRTDLIRRKISYLDAIARNGG